MGLMQSIIEGAEAALRGLKAPHGLPGIEARGTAEAPVLLKTPPGVGGRITERAPNVPFAGAPEIKPYVRATEAKPVTDPVGTLKTLAKAFVERDPEIANSVLRSNDLSEKLYNAAWKHEAAATVADRDVAAWLKPLQKAPAEQAQLLADHLVTADEVAQAKVNGDEKIKGIPREIWEASANRLQEKVNADPEVKVASENIRTALDGMFNDMVSRGWITPDRRLEDYTPIRKINAMLEGLATFTGEDPQALKTRLLSAQHARGTNISKRETDIIDLLRRHRAEYLSKAALHEGFLDLISDPTINFTDKFSGKDDLPQHLAVYRPGPGMFGSTAKTSEGHLLDAHLKAIDPSGKMSPGGYVLPKPLVDSLNEFNKRNLTGTEGKLAKGMGQLAKWLTVYNPANTQVNRASDLLTAMFFPESGQAHPLGVLRWMGKATNAAYGTAFHNKPYHVTLHGRTVDVGDLAAREGLTTGTIQHLVGGEAMPSDLLKYSPEAAALHQKWYGNLLQTMEADRLATEMAPRIAAGLEAVERTGDWSQFGKVGRDITFRYGAGAPRLSKLPIAKAMAPFLQFQGLATQRMLHTWGAKGMEPKARLMLGLAAVPLSIHSWNTQNDAYKQAEMALPVYERAQMHIFMPDPTDPSIPKRDVEGKPVALRFRFWVPDQVAQLAGLGNAAPRAKRVLEGRDTPMQFLKESATEAAENASGMLVYPQIVSQAMGLDRGAGKNPEQRLEGIIPLARTVGETARAAKTYGLGEATMKFLQNISGMRQANVVHKGPGLYDAQWKDAKRAFNKAKGAVQVYKVNGPPDKLKQALDNYVEAAKELKRLAKQIEKEKAAGYKPPSPPAEEAPVIEENKKVLDEFRQRMDKEGLE